MGQDINGKVGPYRRAWEFGVPVKGHDVGLKLRVKGSVRVRYLKVLHRGEGVTKPHSCWVDRGGSTHQSKGGHMPLVGDQDGYRREAGLWSQYGSGGGPKAVCGPALNLVPVHLHLCEHTLCGDDEVSTV